MLDVIHGPIRIAQEFFSGFLSTARRGHTDADADRPLLLADFVGHGLLNAGGVPIRGAATVRIQ